MRLFITAVYELQDESAADVFLRVQKIDYSKKKKSCSASSEADLHLGECVEVWGARERPGLCRLTGSETA